MQLANLAYCSALSQNAYMVTRVATCIENNGDTLEYVYKIVIRYCEGMFHEKVPCLYCICILN